MITLRLPPELEEDLSQMAQDLNVKRHPMIVAMLTQQATEYRRRKAAERIMQKVTAKVQVPQ